MKIFKENENDNKIVIDFDTSYDQITQTPTETSHKRGIELFNPQKSDYQNADGVESVVGMFGPSALNEANGSGTNLQGGKLTVGESAHRSGFENNKIQTENNEKAKKALIEAAIDEIEIRIPIDDEIEKIEDENVKTFVKNNLKLQYLKQKIKHESHELLQGKLLSPLDANVNKKLCALQKDLERTNTELDKQINWNAVDDKTYGMAVDATCKADVEKNGDSYGLNARLKLEMQTEAMLKIPSDKLMEHFSIDFKQKMIESISQDPELNKYLLDKEQVAAYVTETKNAIMQKKPRPELLCCPGTSAMSHGLNELIRGSTTEIVDKHENDKNISKNDKFAKTENMIKTKSQPDPKTSTLSL